MDLVKRVALLRWHFTRIAGRHFFDWKSMRLKLVLVAGHDELVGPAAGLALQAQLATQGDSTLVVLPNISHNTWQFAVTAKQWDQLLH